MTKMSPYGLFLIAVALLSDGLKVIAESNLGYR